ncbi:MAG: hypothetical protein ACQEP4_09215 [Bacillota bacterium]
MEELVERDIFVMIPSYEGESGNCTRLYFMEGVQVVGFTLRTFLRKLCSYHHFDLRASNNHYGKLISARSNLPIPIKTDTIYIQLKVREPIGKDDGAMGYFKLSKIRKIFSREGVTFVRMENGVEYPCLCTVQTANKQLKQGNLVRELMEKKKGKLVSEAMEYYTNQDGPAMKSDIARLYMKLDALLLKIENPYE